MHSLCRFLVAKFITSDLLWGQAKNMTCIIAISDISFSRHYHKSLPLSGAQNFSNEAKIAYNTADFVFVMCSRLHIAVEQSVPTTNGWFLKFPIQSANRYFLPHFHIILQITINMLLSFIANCSSHSFQKVKKLLLPPMLQYVNRVYKLSFIIIAHDYSYNQIHFLCNRIGCNNDFLIFLASLLF